ncbi:MAG: ankyrin repeat domain-containing protein [Kiritimatiellae bacterium]|nr:ankyrin repeat domain-containing protein [Kiritimatiellia bacterium]
MKTLIILDSSVLLQRPRIIYALDSLKIDFICITQTILDEINFQKDHGRKSQQAWLVMKSFNEFQKKDSYRFLVLDDHSNNTLHDKRILDTALFIHKTHPETEIYVLSEDIFFPLYSSNTSQIKIMTVVDFETTFTMQKSMYDRQATFDLFQSLENRDLEKLKQIVSRNPDINARNSKTGFTPLISAIRNRDISSVKLLLSLPNLDIDKCDDANYKLPPLCHAIQMRNKQIFSMLLLEGADVDHCSEGKNAGNTALMIAAWHGNLDFVKSLVEHGACTNQQDSNGFTPLIKACIRGHAEVAEYLLPYTDTSIRSRENKTAWDFAKEKIPHAVSLIKMLLSRKHTLSRKGTVS